MPQLSLRERDFGRVEAALSSLSLFFLPRGLESPSPTSLLESFKAPSLPSLLRMQPDPVTVILIEALNRSVADRRLPPPRRTISRESRLLFRGENNED